MRQALLTFWFYTKLRFFHLLAVSSAAESKFPLLCKFKNEVHGDFITGADALVFKREE